MVKWFLESNDSNEWYICWHEFFDSKEFAKSRLEELGWKSQGLKNDDGSPAKFRVMNYKLIPANQYRKERKELESLKSDPNVPY